jgi:hypothetical protein
LSHTVFSCAEPSLIFQENFLLEQAEIKGFLFGAEFESSNFFEKFGAHL